MARFIVRTKYIVYAFYKLISAYWTVDVKWNCSSPDLSAGGEGLGLSGGDGRGRLIIGT